MKFLFSSVLCDYNMANKSLSILRIEAEALKQDIRNKHHELIASYFDTTHFDDWNVRHILDMFKECFADEIFSDLRLQRRTIHISSRQTLS